MEILGSILSLLTFALIDVSESISDQQPRYKRFPETDVRSKTTKNEARQNQPTENGAQAIIISIAVIVIVFILIMVWFAWKSQKSVHQDQHGRLGRPRREGQRHNREEDQAALVWEMQMREEPRVGDIVGTAPVRKSQRLKKTLAMEDFASPNQACPRVKSPVRNSPVEAVCPSSPRRRSPMKRGMDEIPLNLLE
jgi:hypothetical protein